MPGFGKSGTWRIFDFSASNQAPSRIAVPGSRFDLLLMRGKPVLPSRRFDDVDVERLDVGVGWPATERELHAVDRLLLPFHQRFDAAVGQIPRVSGHSLAGGAIAREHPEADSLHAPADQETSRHDCHSKLKII